MRFLRLLRQYDSVKAAVMLSALAAFLTGYSIRAAAGYAVLLRTPAEFICTAPEGFDLILPRLAQTESVRGYSPQKTAVLSQNDRTLTVTCLSAAYITDCYALTPERVIYANDAAFAALAEDPAAQSLQTDCTLDGVPFSAGMLRTDALPQNQPFAVRAVTAAALHDASELRICMTEPEPAALESLGLHITNPEVQIAADYEKQLVLLRIRFGMLAAVLSCIAAGACLRLLPKKASPPDQNERPSLCRGGSGQRP